jgi:arsenate reductase-like glutaredoxin family protein
MFKIKIFGKQNCDACKNTKEKFNLFLNQWNKKDLAEIEFFDLDTIEGLTEANFLDATNVPTTIIEQDGKEIKRWAGVVPLSKDFREIFEK